MIKGVYLGVRTCELFLCFVAIFWVRVYCVDFFVFFLFYVTGEFHRFLHRGSADRSGKTIAMVVNKYSTQASFHCLSAKAANYVM